MWCASFALSLVKKMKKNEKGKKKGNSNESMVNKNTIQMVKSFTVLRLTGMIGMLNVSLTKEELLSMNKKLNRIRKK